MKMLATDLDGTFLGGTPADQLNLYKWLQDRSNILLVFVTGRGLESVVSLLANEQLPYPDYIICDVGATIVNAHSMESILSLETQLAEQWCGDTSVTKALAGVEGLIRQKVPQRRRCSYYLQDSSKLDQVTKLVKPINCEVVYSANRFLDILPKGVNKGSSLQALVKLLGINPADVLVAGDTLNDLAMFRCGFPGLVVGNAEAALVKETQGIRQILYAQADGAGGILEVLNALEVRDAASRELWSH